MRAIFLALFLAAPALAAPPTIRLATVTSVATMGTRLVLVAGGTTYLAEAATVRIDGDALVLGGGYAMLTTGPAGLKFESEYVDRNGVTRRVVVTCDGMGRAECFEAFRRADALMREAYPEKTQG